MSFGFSIGDLITVAQLAHRLYNGLYLVARGAPEELQSLNTEIGNLALSIDLLVEELRNGDSILTQSLIQANRQKMVNDVLRQSNATLKDLELFSQKHDFDTSDEKKSRGRRIWDRVKWANELKSVNSLRARITRHNGTIHLLLTSAGNSSLERLEKTSNQMLRNVDHIQDLFNAIPLLNPKLSAVEESRSQIILTEAFMREAEKLKPWTAIGFGIWLAAGKWWLLKAQTQLYTDSTSSRLSPQAYADLLKASFILVDIFPNHPQRRFWTGEYLQVELLAEELKRELSRNEKAGLRKPGFRAVEQADLRIWAELAPEVGLKPAAYVETGSYGPGYWETQDEIILWRGFASLTGPEQTFSEDCVVLVLLSKDTQSSRIVCQNQRGSSVFSCRLYFSEMNNIVLKFDHHVWRRFNVPISCSSQSTTLEIKDHTITLLNISDVLELSSVIRAIVLSAYLVQPQVSFIVVIAALLSGCPMVFQRQLSLYRQLDHDIQATNHPTIIKTQTQTIVNQLQSIDDVQIESYSDCSFLDGPAVHEPLGGIGDSDIERKYTNFRRVIADWIYQIVRVCLRLDSMSVTHFDHVYLDENKWYSLGATGSEPGKAPAAATSMADVAQGIAIDFGDIELLKALRWDPRNFDDRSVRLMHFYWDLPKLIDGWYPELGNANCRTNLIGAVSQGYSAVVKATLESNYTEKLMFYPLDLLLCLAASQGHTDVLQILLDLGHENFVTTSWGFDGYVPAINVRPPVYTALSYAAKHGRIDACELLMRYRASWYGTKPNGVGPLHFAARYNHPELVTFLLESGEEIDATDLKGKTPLHQAMKRGYKETAAVLLRHGASVTVAYSLRKGWGVSAFDLALDFNDDGEFATAIFLHAKRNSAVISVARWTMDAMYGVGLTDRLWRGSVLPNLISAGFDVNPIIVDGNAELTLMRWAVRHGRLDYLDVLPRLRARIDADTKRECRRTLQILGWKPADFFKPTLPEIEFDEVEIEKRVKRHSGLQIQKRSFYPVKYIKDGRPSKELERLTSRPAFWLAEPGEEDVVSLSADEDTPDEIFDIGPPGKGRAEAKSPAIKTSDPIRPPVSKLVRPLAKDTITPLPESAQKTEDVTSQPIRINIMFVKDEYN